jgi:hypothetical protein
MARTPSTRDGWCRYYIKRFNRFQHDDQAHLAMWYQLLMLMDDGESPELPPLTSSGKSIFNWR